MVDVICDTSFLIHLATTRIRNLDSLGVEIGRTEFVVPQVVKCELETLTRDPKKAAQAAATLDYIKNLRTVPISGRFADDGLAEYARVHHCMVATMDRGLKKRIKAAGGSVMSFSGDRIVV